MISNAKAAKDDMKNFELLYSPRTEYSNKLEHEETLFNDLTLNFDPITIKIIKKHFKERLGSLNKDEFISILKNHLLSWHQELSPKERERMLIKLLGRLFSEIDLNDNGSMEWAEFTNYIIHNSNSVNKSNTSANNPAYRLRFYYPAKTILETDNVKDIISHAFYIEKFNIFGLVQENKSQMIFYETNGLKRLKCSIDLKEIQREIEELEIQDLDNKAKELVRLEEESKLALKNKIKKNTSYPYEKGVVNTTQYQREYDRPWKRESNAGACAGNSNTLSIRDGLMTQTTDIFSKIQKTRNQFLSPSHHVKKLTNYNELSTPEKLRKEIEKIKATTKNEQEVNKKLTAISTTFIPEYDVLLVSTTNNKICAWQYINGEFKNVNSTREFHIEKNYFKCSILSADTPQNSLSWDPIQKFLYSGQEDGKILKWDLTKSKNLEKEALDFKVSKQKKRLTAKANFNDNDDSPIKKLKVALGLKKKIKIKIPGIDKDIPEIEKRESVSCLLLLGKLQLLAASYYDGNIVLWDTLLKDYRKSYTDQDTGVYSMTFDSVKNLLITAGFNHDIFVYDPYIDGSAIYKLTGHNWSLTTIVTNEKDSEIISLDILGNIKIWDSNNFLNFQSINLNEQIEVKKNQNEHIKKRKLSSNQKMIYLNKIKKILIYGHKLILFETDRSLNPELADDQIILACYFDNITKTIISFCLRKIKLWNIFTGKLKKVYEDPMNNEITALAIDRNMKRAFLGDNMGKIRNYNMKNGKLLKELESHALEINMISHSLDLNIVVSCSVDNVIKIHDDSELTESEVKKELVITTNQIKAIAICEKFARLAIGLSSGVIRFYDIDHFRYDSDSHQDGDTKKSNDEITCLASVKNVEIVFSGHSSGICKFIVAPPSSLKFYEIVSFSNMDIREPEHTIPVTCAEFDYENKLLFLGDQVGILKCYDLSNLYELIDYGLSKSKSDKDPIITLEVIQAFPKVVIPLKWDVEAHKESIKHIHHVSIDPKIIITTSNDLKIRLFNAETGKFKDELQQISVKYKPVPIGIKYHISDPFLSKAEQIDQEEHILLRNDLDIATLQNIDDNDNLQIGEYAKKITEFNAKEKLWQHVKGTNLKDNQSNRWDLEIDIEKVIQREEDEYNEVYKIVKEKEKSILHTELRMQKESIYDDKYQPEFVSEMNEDQLENFSNVLSQKLRQVKLAISKANLGQNRFMIADKEKKEREMEYKMQHTLPNINVKKQRKSKQQLNQQHKGQTITSPYAYVKDKVLNTEGEFNKCKEYFDKGHDNLKKTFEVLMKKRNMMTANNKRRGHLRLMTDDSYLFS